MRVLREAVLREASGAPDRRSAPMTCSLRPALYVQRLPRCAVLQQCVPAGRLAGRWAPSHVQGAGRGAGGREGGAASGSGGRGKCCSTAAGVTRFAACPPCTARSYHCTGAAALMRAPATSGVSSPQIEEQPALSPRAASPSPALCRRRHSSAHALCEARHCAATHVDGMHLQSHHNTTRRIRLNLALHAQHTQSQPVWAGPLCIPTPDPTPCRPQQSYALPSPTG